MMLNDEIEMTISHEVVESKDINPDKVVLKYKEIQKTDDPKDPVKTVEVDSDIEDKA